MKSVNVRIDKIFEPASAVTATDIAALRPEIEQGNALLHSGEGKGNDFLGWVNLPSSITPAQLDEIQEAANVLRNEADLIIAIGIGGSYLGAKAVLEALSGSFDSLATPKKGVNPRVLFAGQNISEDYTWELMEATKNYDIAAIVISKSGTTTEPAIAFRIIRDEIERRYGKEHAARRIVAVTDESKGALRKLADTEGYRTFVIPDNVGGRFSVLTPVGLLPLAVAGVDVRGLVAGAAEMEKLTAEASFDENPAMQYAAARTALYRAGKKIEILASYEPKLQNIGEWWKQLYGESEGKEGKGIFPASVTLTADLHSMGQYIQQGERTMFETVIRVAEPAHTFRIEADKENLDGLNFLAGKRIGEVNGMAILGTMLAHVDGGVPNIVVELPRIDARTIGALLYMFEKACGISGYALGVNPFDQPGVEAYKKNMFALLGKPGYEAEGETLRKRL
ncbi:glucose-6-phosphate isomerase [uncultured Rikenella sp.]|uniref:glucose-6-phosphate isomerase n=1 Tax=uncultured Rikenella sp. TaxID=368003 RepID=UPI002631BA5E|nr:glucose-6-phosphate isomerase [uncultured Rikenella sp.]